MVLHYDKLESIKKIVQFNQPRHNDLTMTINIEDVKWLIEQAEKLEKLIGSSNKERKVQPTKIKLLDQVLEQFDLDMKKTYEVLGTKTIRDDQFYIILNEKSEEVDVIDLLAEEI